LGFASYLLVLVLASWGSRPTDEMTLWQTAAAEKGQSQQRRKDSRSSTITHVDIKGGSESSHLILQDLQCDFRCDLFLVLVLAVVFQLFLRFSFR